MKDRRGVGRPRSSKITQECRGMVKKLDPMVKEARRCRRKLEATKKKLVKARERELSWRVKGMVDRADEWRCKAEALFHEIREMERSLE